MALWVRMPLLAPMVAVPALGQQAPSYEEMKKDIRELKKNVRAIQGDREDIKAALLARPAAPADRPSLINKVIDLGSGPFKGKADAKVTLVEVSDYQCPFCGLYSTDASPQIESECIKAGKVESVFLDLPLVFIHRAAFGAAKAARCAGDQGEYWQMPVRLFANQKASSRGARTPRQSAWT